MYWVKIVLGVMFHPIAAFERIKYYRDRLSYMHILLLFVLIMAVRVIYIYLVHFPLAQLNPSDTNITLEIIKYIVPVISWGIVMFAITSIWEGECFLKESIAGTCIAMTPFIILTIPVALLSRIMDINQKGFFSFMNTVIYIWIALLLLIGTMTLNGYEFKQAVKVCAVCVIGVLLFWAVFMLLATLVYQVYDFIKGIMVELRIKLG